MFWFVQQSKTCRRMSMTAHQLIASLSSLTGSSFARFLLFSWMLEDASSSCCTSIWSWQEASCHSKSEPKLKNALMRFATKTGLFLYSFPFKTKQLSASARVSETTESLQTMKTWAQPWPPIGNASQKRKPDSWSSWGSRASDSSCVIRFSFLGVRTVGGVSHVSDAERISCIQLFRLYIICKSDTVIAKFHAYLNIVSIPSFTETPMSVAERFKHRIQGALPTWQLFFEVP